MRFPDGIHPNAKSYYCYGHFLFLIKLNNRCKVSMYGTPNFHFKVANSHVLVHVHVPVFEM